MRRILALPCVFAGAALGLTNAVPANASVNVLYTVEADAPHVSIAYAPGQWQDYVIPYSNLAGRYSLTGLIAVNSIRPPAYIAGPPAVAPVPRFRRGRPPSPLSPAGPAM